MATSNLTRGEPVASELPLAVRRPRGVVAALAVVLAAVALAAVVPSASARHWGSPPLLQLASDGFHDASGQRVWLRGFDTTGDGIPDPVSYQQASALGANFARLVVYWDELEPKPPSGGVHTYNIGLLAEIDAEVQSFARQSVYVLIDPHMWSWSPYFDSVSKVKGHGIPPWELTGYPRTAAGMQQSEADWWTNSRGLADYQAFAQMLVNRYSAFPNVIAFEIFNEPPWGTLPQTHATTQLILRWEAQVAAAIRATGTKLAIAFQPRGGGDLGLLAADLSPFGSLTNMLLDFHDYFSGHPCTGLARNDESWSPGWNQTHVQTESAYTGTFAMQDSVLSFARAQAARLGLPLLVGEWGNLRTSAHLDVYQSQLLALLTQYRLDWARWSLSRWGPIGLLNPDRTGTPTTAAQQIRQALLNPIAPQPPVPPTISGTLAGEQPSAVSADVRSSSCRRRKRRSPNPRLRPHG